MNTNSSNEELTTAEKMVCEVYADYLTGKISVEKLASLLGVEIED